MREFELRKEENKLIQDHITQLVKEGSSAMSPFLLAPNMPCPFYLY